MNKRPLLPGARKHTLEHRVLRLEKLTEDLMATAADLTAAVAALTDAVAKVPAPAPQLITQDELDANTAGVTKATADLQAKTPPTP
jgi:hypothetical protein